MSLTVLIVGGYGVFGARLARLLAHEPRLRLLVAGRSADKAGAFCARWTQAGGAILEPALFDRNGDTVQQLATLTPDLVVDCSGPFQAYGETPFRLVEACLARGCDYLDVADASDFVLGIERFDALAKDKGAFAISGASTCPALTAAAVGELTDSWTAVHDIGAGIAPSPYADVGVSVLQAITSYAGKPVPLLRNARPATGLGLVEARNVTVAPPGKLPLYSTRFSLVDVPDLTALPKLWPDVRDIWLGAGPRPELLHRMLNALARLVSLGIPLPLVKLSRLFHTAKTRLKWGEDRGGMFVRVAGLDGEGRPAARSWNLVAEGDDGPFIPSMAAAAIILNLLDGRRPRSGARTAAGAVTLADYQRLFATKRITTGIRDEQPSSAPVYQQVMANAWTDLPPAIRALHDLPEGGRMAAEGRVDVDRGANPLAQLMAAVIGFPGAQKDGHVRVDFDRKGGVETWTRTFGNQSFTSRQFAGRGRSTALAVEAFGPMGCGMAPVLDGDRLLLIPRRWTVFGVGLPSWLFPRIEAWEADEDGRFRFHVDISHPLTGPIVLYRGWLEVKGA
ncbi:MAG: saccharopine dehydrogenase [Caulobacter sp.]|nr:saccharopine dehydrogenase [Caulobacter sp.]